MQVSALRLIISGICLSFCLSQFVGAAEQNAAEEKIVAQKFKAAEAPTTPKTRRNFIDKLYSFLVRTLSHDSIHKNLDKTYQDQNIEARKKYNFIFLGEDMGTSTDEHKVKQNVNTEMSNAAVQESLRSMDALKNLTSFLTFDFDLFAVVYTQENAAAESSPGALVKKGRAAKGQKTVSANSNGSATPVESEVATAKNDKYSLANAGKFKASIAPSVNQVNAQSNPESTKLEFNLNHFSDTYSLRLPIAKGSDEKSLVQIVRVPLGYKNMHAGREMDYQGKPIKSSLLNVYPSTKHTSLNVHYMHLTEAYGADLTYSFRRQYLTLAASMPKDDFGMESYRKEETKVNLEYTLTL